MQPPAASEGSRCACLSVFISCVLWLMGGGGVIQEQHSRLSEAKAENMEVSES